MNSDENLSLMKVTLEPRELDENDEDELQVKHRYLDY
jgi:hypothetical protein